MLKHGASRRQIARMLKAAFANGLLSEETFAGRIDQLLRRRLVDPPALVGDLSFRRRGWRHSVAGLRSAISGGCWRRRGQGERLLALDWSGQEQELLIGRHFECDVMLSDPTVSRRHARAFFRDGGWILQDLGSMNGTMVNGSMVGRCVLRPGDHLVLGDERLKVD